MATSTLQPLVQAFVVCRRIVKPPDGGELTLVGPFSRVTASQFPADIPLSAYAHLTDARGRYQVSLQLVDDEGNMAWRGERVGVVEQEDPLCPHRVTFPDIVVPFPRAGRYDLEMLANGATLAHHGLWARVATRDDA